MRSFAIIILAVSLLFFLIGLYEWSKAKESAHWPARAAKITVELPRWAGMLIDVAMALLFLRLDIWMIFIVLSIFI